MKTSNIWAPLAAVVMFVTSVAVGQVGHVSEQLALARICVSEAGFSAWRHNDCAAIYEAISQSARNRSATLGRTVTWMERAREHSRRVFETGRVDPRGYVARLMPDGSEPVGWPRTATVRREDGSVSLIRHVGWEHRREDWMRIYDLAGRIVRGEVSSGCEEAPVTWGCPGDGWRDCGDHARALARGLERVECEDTVNWFYRTP